MTRRTDRSSRRRFLRGLSGAAATAATGPLLAQATTPQPRTVVTRPIPSSGEPLPIMGLGTFNTFNVEAGAPQVENLRQVLERFHELGGTLVDSSPMYGHSEALTGMMARRLGLTDKLFFATKVWTQGRAEGQRQMDTSAKHFQTDVIDLMQVHNLVDLNTQLASVRQRREQGRVRYVGVTHYRTDMHDTVADLLQREPLDFLQINYSIASRNIEQRVLPVATERGVAVIVNRNFEGGGLFRRTANLDLPAWVGPLEITSWAQYFLKFVLSHPGVNAAIPATSNIEHLEDNMQAAVGAMPDSKLRERMAEYFAQLA